MSDSHRPAGSPQPAGVPEQIHPFGVAPGEKTRVEIPIGMEIEQPEILWEHDPQTRRIIYQAVWLGTTTTAAIPEQQVRQNLEQVPGQAVSRLLSECRKLPGEAIDARNLKTNPAALGSLLVEALHLAGRAEAADLVGDFLEPILAPAPRIHEGS